ncbi:hypothetical protein QCM77_24580 [Bradyrhizobium sp. SSUT18]|uniref:hypothetical protein n=1 Tax=unclassified Bradyrhizobium TaxID=2631580 RepID=UPI00244774A3|nr:MULTISPECIES: hypothetical protein [unclassified Bradyrhizobium]MDH2354663.1 hypothetical protein [Bradyrhizobium sp. SSUT112]MDH2403108.1 hypothetical protein [Bradyrhizobium sp. SSUT18]
MGNRTAKFISALVGSIIAGAPLAAVSQNAPTTPSTENAASDCLGAPKGAAPQGQHWHYRLERATKRQCWYLRAEGGKATQTAQAAPDTPTADSAVPQQHSVQDARAEYLMTQSIAAAKTPAAPTQQSAGPSADANAQQPAVAARWPDASTASAAPAAQPSPAPVAAAAQPSAKPAKSPAPMALAAADSTADKPTGSLQMLLLVIGGALALAGILASVIYRFAGGRTRVQAADHHRVNWDNFEPHDHDDGRAPWLNAAPAGAPRAQQPRPVDFDAVRPQAAQLKTAQLAAIDREIDVIDERNPQAHDETDDIFNGEFEIEAAAPRLAANDINDEEPADRDEDVGIEDAIDVDVITTMLERLAKDGPRLMQPSLEADLADRARSPRGRSAARA